MRQSSELEQAPFASEIVSSILAIRSHAEKNQSALSAESRGFSPGAPVSSHREVARVG